ncbi:hypothetical protein [Paenibacillus cymbidii]|uniref:hypothetical protein n=1 Tax=Paenibacillus cymbidii TaxID=1639034 RepID=UPI001081FE24|nr:hypothetical protein [Paenibacillus cymbidii]
MPPTYHAAFSLNRFSVLHLAPSGHGNKLKITETNAGELVSPRRIEVLPGDRYGRLTIISELPKAGKERRFLCRCECGNELPVKMLSLRSGNTQSCGCLKSEVISSLHTIDLVGKTFGDLTVIEQAGRYHGQIAWLCKCSCGESIEVWSQGLRDGNVTSCGHTEKQGSKRGISGKSVKLSSHGIIAADTKDYQHQYYMKVLKDKRSKPRQP